MSFSHIETIEIAMNNEDGTYRLQEVRESEDGRSVLRTITDAPSITAGLTKLSLAIHEDALKEFGLEGHRVST